MQVQSLSCVHPGVTAALSAALRTKCLRLRREESGGADPGMDSVPEYEPEARWQCPLGPARLAWAISLTALQLDVLPSAADWSLIAEVRPSGICTPLP